MKVSVQAAFPESEIFGIKIVNGRTTQSVLSVENNEAEAIFVAYVTGSLRKLTSDIQKPATVRNLTTSQFDVQIPPGGRESIIYSFTTDLHPQEVKLQLLAAILKDKNVFTVEAFNASVAIVEAPTSIFDPQM